VVIVLVYFHLDVLHLESVIKLHGTRVNTLYFTLIKNTTFPVPIFKELPSTCGHCGNYVGNLNRPGTIVCKGRNSCRPLNKV
jgi:hypothetical protein